MLRWLNHTDQSRQYAQHPTLRAGGDEPGGRRLGIQAAIALVRPACKHRRLPIEPKNAAIDVRLPGQHAGVVDKIARSKVVGPVDDHVVRREEGEALADDSRSLWRTTWTCGLRSLRCAAAALVLSLPTSDVPYSTCRCRLLTSTVSSRRCLTCRHRPQRDTAGPAIPIRRRPPRARALL